jgi:hypothetical protein
MHLISSGYRQFGYENAITAAARRLFQVNQKENKEEPTIID